MRYAYIKAETQELYNKKMDQLRVFNCETIIYDVNNLRKNLNNAIHNCSYEDMFIALSVNDIADDFQDFIDTLKQFRDKDIRFIIVNEGLNNTTLFSRQLIDIILAGINIAHELEQMHVNVEDPNIGSINHSVENIDRILKSNKVNCLPKRGLK